MIKTILKWTALIILGFIILFTLIVMFVSHKQNEYEDTAVPYLKQVIPTISEWKPEKAKPFFVPSTFEDVSDEDFNKLFKWFSKLGQLKSMEEPQFQKIFSGATVREGANTIVTYKILVHYDNGDAQLTIQLLDLGNSFEIYHFNLNSTVLIE